MASIEYRLTPSITFPSNVEDVTTAIRCAGVFDVARAFFAKHLR